MRFPCILSRYSEIFDAVDDVGVLLWRDDREMRRKLHFNDLVFTTVDFAPENSLAAFLPRICASCRKVVLLVVHHDTAVYRILQDHPDARAWNVGQFRQPCVVVFTIKEHLKQYPDGIYLGSVRPDAFSVACETTGQRMSAGRMLTCTPLCFFTVHHPLS